MLKSSNSSQSSAPTQYNVGNGGVMVCGGRWDQVDSNNMLQNTKPLEWNELPPHSNVSANLSSEYHVATSVNNVNVNKVNANNINNNMNNGSNVNIISNQVVYPPNYMNVPYQRNGGSNGYISLNPTNHPPQIINGQNFLPTQNGQIIGGPGWPNQSDHGRFISQHQSPHQPGWTCKKTTGVKKQKRIRTAFTTQQMMDLEQEYARSRFLDRARRLQLADLLRLNERTIKIWFQNRRMKEKKDRAEAMEEAVVASSSNSSPIQMPMLIHEQYPAITNEVYHQGNIYVEQYPVTSTPISMPATSLPTSTAVQSSAQNMYENFMSEECREQYQQVPSYQSSYTAPQELSAEVEPKAGPSTSSAPSGIVEKSWDVSWLRLDNDEEGLLEFNFK